MQDQAFLVSVSTLRGLSQNCFALKLKKSFFDVIYIIFYLKLCKLQLQFLLYDSSTNPAHLWPLIQIIGNATGDTRYTKVPYNRLFDHYMLLEEICSHISNVWREAVSYAAFNEEISRLLASLDEILFLV